jgi:hypothetical protein
MPRLDATQGRILAAFLMGAILVLLWFGLIQPIVSVAQGDHAIVIASENLEQQRAIAARQEGLRAEKAARDAAPKDDGDYLAGADSALAAAQLQSQLGPLLRSLGATLSSAEPLSLPDQEGFRRAGLRLKLGLAESSLPAFLHTLENGRPRLFFAALAIKSAGNGQ